MYTKEERIAETRKYITEYLAEKNRRACGSQGCRARAAAKITELDDGKEPPKGTYTYISSALTKYLGSSIDTSKLTGYMVCFNQAIDDELWGEAPWDDPTPYPENLDRDLAWYLQPLLYERYDETYLDIIIEDLLTDLPERLRDDAHRNALKVIRALYDEIRRSSIEDTFIDLTKLRIN